MIDINNPWIVGIIPAIISGLIVNFLSRLISSTRDKRKARKKIVDANNEVMSSLRLSLAEDALLSNEILDSLVHATANKHGLAEELMMSSELFSDTLIKEVLDSNFLSQAQKVDYSKRIIRRLKPKTPPIESELSEIKILEKYYDNYNKTNRKYYANTVSGLVASVVLLVTSFSIMPEQQKDFFMKLLEIFWPYIALLIGFALGSALLRKWIDSRFNK
jgi:uncharacterized integral membrane protein